MTVDLLTKPLTRGLHWRHTKGIRMAGSMHELGTSQSITFVSLMSSIFLSLVLMEDRHVLG